MASTAGTFRPTPCRGDRLNQKVRVLLQVRDVALVAATYIRVPIFERFGILNRKTWSVNRLAIQAFSNQLLSLGALQHRVRIPKA